MTGRFARAPTSTFTRASLLVAGVVAGAVVAVLGLAVDVQWLALIGLLVAVVAAGVLAASLLVTEQGRGRAHPRLGTRQATRDDPLAPRALVPVGAGRAAGPGVRPGGARARGTARDLEPNPDRPRRRPRRDPRRTCAGRDLPDHP